MSNKTENKEKNTVTVTVPLSREETGDIYLCINGKAIQIQRGVAVELPRDYARLLARSVRQQRAAFEFEQQMKE